VLGALITGGSWSVRMNFDAMSRAAPPAHHAGRSGRGDDGRAAGECRASNSQVIHSKTARSELCKIVADGKASKVWTADELKAIKLRRPASTPGRPVGAASSTCRPRSTQRKYGIDAMVAGMLYGKPVMPPVRYGAKVTAVDDSAAKRCRASSGR